MKKRRFTRPMKDDERCACLSCCALDPPRLALREKRGFGQYNGNRLGADGKVVKR